MLQLLLCCVFILYFGLFSNAALKAPTKRTVIVTGANRGIGLAAIKSLAATDDWNIVMACRSTERAEAAKKMIKNSQNIEVCELDLSDLKSVKKFAAGWGSRPLHVLACNAGITDSLAADVNLADDMTDHYCYQYCYVTALWFMLRERGRECKR
jgi:NAD(P)-dependent dehydrogenase (short-subunit alcohol dehydrogenase family)